MVVYVKNMDNEPLMPCSPRKARILLKEKKAFVVNRTPFIIKLNYPCTNYMQENVLKVDAGSKYIGVSVVCEDSKTELYSGEVELRSDVVECISTRRELRKSRRSRKTRYRKARFSNRKRKEGTLAPSIKQKIQTHISVINRICNLLPISFIIVETASFDIQKIKNPDIEGTEYQNGEQKGFDNVRQYVFFRDNYTCQCCKGKSKDKTLCTHHIESRKTGGNAPNNLITLCKTCHTRFHEGKIQLSANIKRDKSFRDSAFMGIMRKALLNELVVIYGDKVHQTFGYITKENRIANHLPKMHRVDALCIEEPNAKDIKPLDVYYYERKVRCHNRQIHKQNFCKGGKRKLNQAPYKVLGFRLFDKVLYDGKECFISGRRSSGYFKLVRLDGTIIHNSASYKKLTLLESSRKFLIEKRINIYK